jgi:hypothetical protein
MTESFYAIREKKYKPTKGRKAGLLRGWTKPAAADMLAAEIDEQEICLGPL